MTIITVISAPGNPDKTGLTLYKTIKLGGDRLIVNKRSEETDPQFKPWETKGIYVRN